MKIVLPGGTGQVGTVLARHFHAAGHEVVALARKPVDADWRVVPWDGLSIDSWAMELDGSDVVINLAGRSVNRRYTAKNRRRIKRSRVVTTRLVGEAIATARKPPRTWLQMSTATIYAHRFDAPNDEATGILGGDEPNAPDTWRFSIDVARSWEDQLDKAQVPRTRRVKLRAAVIMSPDRGGVFDTLLGLVRRGLGGTSGNGKQYVSWIHETDFIRAIEHVLAHDEIHDAINLAAPNPLPNAAFMRDLRAAWGTSVGLPASRWMLELGAMVLRTETELILKSRRVVPGILLDRGFEFRFPTWPEAADDLCRRWRANSHGTKRVPPC